MGQYCNAAAESQLEEAETGTYTVARQALSSSSKTESRETTAAKRRRQVH